MLQASVAAVTNGNNGVYQRIKQYFSLPFIFQRPTLRIFCYRFYPNYTPLLFIKKQFQTRLAILHPDFLKVSLKSTKTNTIVPFIHSTNCAWRSKYGKSSCYDWFRCILTTFVLLTSIELLQSPDYWCSCLFVHIKKQNNILFKWSFLIFTIQSLIHRLYYITDFLTQLATEYHNKYKINVFLFAEICSTLVDILSDCLRYFFFSFLFLFSSYDFANTYQSAWYTYFGALITEMKSLPCIDNSSHIILFSY